jgi:hypothetical protein
MLSSAHALNDTQLYEHVVEEPVVEAEPLEIWYVNPPLGVYLLSDQNVAKHKEWGIYFANSSSYQSNNVSDLLTPLLRMIRLPKVLEDDPLWKDWPAELPAEPAESDQLSVQPPDPRMKVLVIESPGYAICSSIF